MDTGGGWGWPVQKIMANPGAVVAPEEVVGRTSVVSEIVDSTSGRGALLWGDRRMGKTSLLGPVMALLEGGPFVVLRVGGETTRPEVLEARLLMPFAATPGSDRSWRTGRSRST